MYRTLLLTGLVCVPSLAMAAEEESPHSFSANVSLTSNYIFRGISQTGGDPAVQGGFDYSHSSGFYVGTWGSNVGWIEDFQGYDSGNLEIDLYAGLRGGIGDSGVTYDVGLIRYWYPGDKPAGVVDADTTEIYAALGWKWFTLKYSRALSDEVFGFDNAKGSDYIDLSFSLPIGETGLTLGAHWGRFEFDSNGPQDYDDWKLSLAYDMGKMSKVLTGVTAGVMYTDTDAKKARWTDANNENLGKSATTFWISKAF
ncbi:MAG: hypothetical protein FJ209_12890 [Betaproteobacteria bacterium]|nr:hypothetical protein [Betaproteobacteria bacterium]